MHSHNCKWHAVLLCTVFHAISSLVFRMYYLLCDPFTCDQCIFYATSLFSVLGYFFPHLQRSLFPSGNITSAEPQGTAQLLSFRLTVPPTCEPTHKSYPPSTKTERSATETPTFITATPNYSSIATSAPTPSSTCHPAIFTSRG